MTARGTLAQYEAETGGRPAVLCLRRRRRWSAGVLDLAHHVLARFDSVPTTAFYRSPDAAELLSLAADCGHTRLVLLLHLKMPDALSLQ
ncbi:hypothetical protein CDD83_11245 [Cordyceps sp. RAO-2017]|nr:hypothetical protein CDD83_11245 [Cordyceps sp. RAO-2017]